MNKKIINSFLNLFFFFAITFLYAQEVRVIDNKGTKKSINKVRYGTVAPTPTSPINNVKGDFYIIGSATNPEKTYLFDGTQWVETSANNWSLTGNAGTNASTNFLGTTDAQDLVLKANNTEALRILNNNRFVGIATSTPTSTLHVVGDHADGVGLLRLEGTEPDINFNDTNGGFNTFTFENNGQGRVLIGRDIDDNFYISRRVGTNLWQDQTFRILNSNGNVGININRLAATDNVPSEKLDVNGKLRVRDVSEVTNLSVGDKIVIIDANGVVKKIAGSFHTVGDIKYSVQDNDHDGWYKLDGRANTDATLTSDAQANASSLFLSGNLPDATDRVLKHPSGGQTILLTGGNPTTTLNSLNIPQLTGVTTSNGDHNHLISDIYRRDIAAIHWGSSSGRFYGNSGNNNTNLQTDNNGSHNHNVTVNVGNTTPNSFENYQPYLVVNTFIYLGQ